MFELVKVWAAASKQCPASQSYSSVKLLYVSSPCILSSPSVTHLSPVLSPALFRLVEFPAVLTTMEFKSIVVSGAFRNPYGSSPNHRIKHYQLLLHVVVVSVLFKISSIAFLRVLLLQCIHLHAL
jgi:hypothetical protein